MHQTRFHHHVILILSNHQNHRQVPILSRSQPHFPGFSREDNQAPLERELINSGFHVTGEIRSEGIYLQVDPKMEDHLNQVDSVEDAHFFATIGNNFFPLIGGHVII